MVRHVYGRLNPTATKKPVRESNVEGGFRVECYPTLEKQVDYVGRVKREKKK